METSEIKSELSFDYKELVKYLLKKYGAVQGDYFCTDSCKSRNKKISRIKDGLYCHHIDEYRAIKLSDPKMAVYYPFEYQKADRLVYCNVLEHLILHIKIIQSQNPFGLDALSPFGIGGLLNICFCINDYYNGYQYKRESDKNIYSVIENNFDDYIYILKELLKSSKNIKEYDGLINKKNLSLGWKGEIIKKVYDRL